MKTQFKIGQVVRFKNYKHNEAEKEAYFIVIQEEDASNEMELFTINSNRIYTSGSTIIPVFPEEDLRLVALRPSDLMLQKITIKDKTFNESLLEWQFIFLVTMPLFNSNKLVLLWFLMLNLNLFMVVTIN